MTPADFQSEYGSNSNVASVTRPVLHVVGQDKAAEADFGQAAAGQSGQRQQSGFLNQSIDEIARLYVESPFSW